MINLKNSKCILVYGLENSEIIELMKRRIEYIIIDQSKAGLKIKDIINGAEGINILKDIPNEKVILFNGFEDNKLQKNIKKIRSFIKGGILAVVTETSREWTFIDLLNHLIEEREWFSKNN